VDTVPVGVCTLAPHRTDIELSYTFLPEHSGHGYVPQACLAVLEFGFATHPQLGRIIAVTQTGNAPSHRLLSASA
jgi:RimJ/RimL family protein N-acetyltransferase